MASAAVHLHLQPPLSPSFRLSTLKFSCYFNSIHRYPDPHRRRFHPISASRPQPSCENEVESRWLREEQRWLREEQRWLREEARCNAQRESLLREIAALREELERGRSCVNERALSVEVFFRALKERVAPPPVLVKEADVKEIVLEGSVEKEVVEKKVGEIEGLSIGPEEDVRVLQAESNGAPSVLNISEVKQTVIKDNDNGDDVSLHRVFLLGENRWEEPSRLAKKDNLISKSMNISLVKCLTCRGEGRLLCIECDGTGEPNVEPQFLEWVGEGMKCPYCKGLEYIICDVCYGKTSVDK